MSWQKLCFSNCELAKKINFNEKLQVQKLIEQIQARLASVVTDKLLCDILYLLTEHSQRNFVACQNDLQVKIT